MNTPGFTAEVSLCRASGQYQTAGNAVNSPAHRVSGINAAMMNEEVISVHGCAPGWTDLGGTCWPNPLSEPGGFGSPGGGGDRGVPRGPSDGPHRAGGGEAGRQHRRRDLTTLGDGPQYRDLLKKDYLECENVGLDARECHSSCHRPGDVCYCYFCQPSTNSCTDFYDCTSTYKK